MLNRMEDEPSLVADPEATTRPLLQNGPAFRLHCQFRCSVSRKFKVVPLVTAGNRLAKNVFNSCIVRPKVNFVNDNHGVISTKLKKKVT